MYFRGGLRCISHFPHTEPCGAEKLWASLFYLPWNLTRHYFAERHFQRLRTIMFVGTGQSTMTGQSTRRRKSGISSPFPSRWRRKNWRNGRDGRMRRCARNSTSGFCKGPWRSWSMGRRIIASEKTVIHCIWWSAFFQIWSLGRGCLPVRGALEERWEFSANIQHVKSLYFARLFPKILPKT